MGSKTILPKNQNDIQGIIYYYYTQKEVNEHVKVQAVDVCTENTWS